MAGAAAEVPAAAALAQLTLGSYQHGHDRQGNHREQGGAAGVTFHLPAIQNPRREAWYAQQPHGPQFVDHLHGTEGDAGPDRGHRNRQSYAPEAAPGTYAQAATGLQQSSAAHREAFGAQQKHVAVIGEGEQGDGPERTMDQQAPLAPPIDQAGGLQVSRKSHRQQLGNAQQSAAWKTAHGAEPASRGAQTCPQEAFAQHQQQRAADLIGTIDPEPKALLAGPSQGVPSQGDQGQQAEQADYHHRGQQAEAPLVVTCRSWLDRCCWVGWRGQPHFQPLVAIKATAALFWAPNCAAESRSGLKLPKRCRIGLLP